MSLKLYIIHVWGVFWALFIFWGEISDMPRRWDLGKFQKNFERGAKKFTYSIIRFLSPATPYPSNNEASIDRILKIILGYPFGQVPREQIFFPNVLVCLFFLGFFSSISRQVLYKFPSYIEIFEKIVWDID